MSLIVTGFGPFGSVRENPSATLARESGQLFEVLEVSYAAVDDFIASLDPETFGSLIMLGVASSRKTMSLELFARNYRRGTDVKGESSDGLIDESAPLLQASTLWTADVASDLVVSEPKLLGTSLDAGAYLCNYIAFKALRRFPEKPVGFVHVPLPEVIPFERQAKVLTDIFARVRPA
jgi:pyroglutamyl-peptidase